MILHISRADLREIITNAIADRMKSDDIAPPKILASHYEPPEARRAWGRRVGDDIVEGLEQYEIESGV